VSLEDHTGVLEVVFFPDVCNRYGAILDEAPLVVRGRITEDQGAVTMEADALLKTEG